MSGKTVALRAVCHQWEPNERLRMLIGSMHGPIAFEQDALGHRQRPLPHGAHELRMPDAAGNLSNREHRG